MLDRPRAVVLACAIGFFWVQSSRAVLYSAMPAITLETGLDAAGVGVVTGALYASYAVALYVSGFLPLGRRATIVGGFLLTAVANVAFAFTHGRGEMLVVAVAGGAGIGLYLPRGTAAIVEAFAPGARARAIGWHELSASLGLVVAPLFMAGALLLAPWRVGVAAWSVVGVAAAVAVHRWVPDAPPAAAASHGRLPVDSRALGLAAMGGGCFAVISGFFTMLPTIAARAWEVTPAAAAGFAGWTRAGGLAGALLGGVVADRLGRGRSLAAWYAVALATLAALPSLPYGVALGVVVMVATLAASGAATAYYALLGDTYRAEERERIFGPIQATASLIGSAATPVALGVVLEHASAAATLAAMTAAPLLGLAGLGAYRLGTRRR